MSRTPRAPWQWPAASRERRPSACVRGGGTRRAGGPPNRARRQGRHAAPIPRRSAPAHGAARVVHATATLVPGCPRSPGLSAGGACPPDRLDAFFQRRGSSRDSTRPFSRPDHRGGGAELIADADKLLQDIVSRGVFEARVVPRFFPAARQETTTSRCSPTTAARKSAPSSTPCASR